MFWFILKYIFNSKGLCINSGYKSFIIKKWKKKFLANFENIIIDQKVLQKKVALKVSTNTDHNLRWKKHSDITQFTLILSFIKVFFKIKDELKTEVSMIIPGISALPGHFSCSRNLMRHQNYERNRMMKCD